MDKAGVLKRLRTVPIILFSALLYAIAMNVFVEAGQLFPGGFAGVSQLISRSLAKFAGFNLPFGFIYFFLNAACTVFVFRAIGKWFTIYSVVWFTAASFFTSILPDFPLTSDPLLIAVFGGILGGTAIGLALQHNASSGGTDFLAIYASSRYNIPTWNYVLGANVIVLGLAGFLFGWNQALYSIIYQFCSTQIVSTMHKRFKLNNLFIVTDKPEEICEVIYKTCRHGITKVFAEGEYSHMPKSLLFMTVNAYQVRTVIDAVREVDPHVFINVASAERIVGNYYQKPLD